MTQERILSSLTLSLVSFWDFYEWLQILQICFLKRLHTSHHLIVILTADTQNIVTHQWNSLLDFVLLHSKLGWCCSNCTGKTDYCSSCHLMSLEQTWWSFHLHRRVCTLLDHAVNMKQQHCIYYFTVQNYGIKWSVAKMNTGTYWWTKIVANFMSKCNMWDSWRNMFTVVEKCNNTSVETFHTSTVML